MHSVERDQNQILFNNSRNHYSNSMILKAIIKIAQIEIYSKNIYLNELRRRLTDQKHQCYLSLLKNIWPTSLESISMQIEIDCNINENNQDGNPPTNLHCTLLHFTDNNYNDRVNMLGDESNSDLLTKATDFLNTKGKILQIINHGNTQEYVDIPDRFTNREDQMNHLETFQYDTWVLIKLLASSSSNDPMSNVLHINGKYLPSNRFYLLMSIITFMTNNLSVNAIKFHLNRLYDIDDEVTPKRSTMDYDLVSLLLDIMPTKYLNVLISEDANRHFFEST
jgi:hypothetical protein